MEVSEGCEDIGMREDYKLLVQILLSVILRFLNRVARITKLVYYILLSKIKHLYNHNYNLPMIKELQYTINKTSQMYTSW